MTTAITIHIKDLGAELRDLPKRDHLAVRSGIRRTLEYDAHRWIQWSIRGGGFGGRPAPRTEKPKKPKRPKPKSSVLRRIITKLSMILGTLRKLRGKPPRKEPPLKDACEPSEAPSYREPVDTGNYKDSWTGVMTPDGGEFYSAASPPVKAGVIELGRRPAPIPIRPLAEWVRRKLGCKDPKKALGIAIAISKTAAKTERKGLRVLERAHPKIAEALEKNVYRELKKARRRK